jgi:hypothetical protein
MILLRHLVFGASTPWRNLPFIGRKRVQLRQQWIHSWLSEPPESEANQNQTREQKNRFVGIHKAFTRENRRRSLQ